MSNTSPRAALSPNELDRLLSAVDGLPASPDPSRDTIRLGQLISEESANWPQLIVERQCTPGEIVFWEDEPGDSMYIILEGRLAVVKGDFLSPVVLGCRHAGESIGEMALLEGEKRSASVAALEPLRLLEINRESFQKLLAASPTFSQGIMQLLSARVREASEAVERETLDKIRDPLTGLYNRRFMQATLEQELLRAARAGYPVSLIMLDIDHFKEINDTYGHQAGDQMLHSLGELLLSHVRRADVACRYGGEEFLIIMPETLLEVAQRRAEELRKTFATLQIEYDGHRLQRTLSLGVAVFPRHGATPEQLVSAADQALYAAKSGGRNQIVVAYNGK